MPARARLLARVEAIALPWRPSRPQVHPRVWLARLVPTRRSLAVGFGVLGFALGAYLIARETPLFAIDRIEVQGGPPQVAHQVREVLAPLAGKSLVGLDGSAVLRRVDALPRVLSATYDRAFPHTLRIAVVPERPAVVLRRGPDSWLVSATGRVIEHLAPTVLPRLSRVWIPSRMRVATGAELTAGGAGAAARAVGVAGGFGAQIDSASDRGGELLFRLRSGLELLLGDGGDVRLKVAVAKRVLPRLPSGSTFLDVSIPGRPVSGTGTPLSFSPKSSGRG